MVRYPQIFVIIFNGLLWFALTNGAAAQDLRVETVTVVTAQGKFDFQAEIADTPEARQKGLMFRKSMPANRGMLFDYGGSTKAAMWMRNTYISLDMLFIARDGTVRYVAENTKPLTLDVISAGIPVAAVLEVIAGTAKRIGLKPGDRVIHPMFKQL